MRSRPRSAAALFVLMLIATPAFPQAEKLKTPAAPAVTVSITAAGVRFAAPNRVARVRLEVLSASGEVLFEAASKGSVLDWTLQDGQGVRLADGSYLCVLTVKDVAGRITQRLTLVEITGGAAAARQATAASMTAAQAEAVGPVAAEEDAVITAEAEAPAATLLAHDGTQGQVVTTAGDLSFRGGDFFTGRDRELMRLSQDGSLEVSGLLLARGGIRFSDGTILNSAAGLGRGGQAGKGAAKASEGDPGVSPSAIVNRLAKFSSAGGSVTDSAVSEVGGTVGVGTDAPDAIYKLDVRGHVVLGNTRRVSLVADFPGNGEIAAGGFFGSLGNNSLTFAPSTDAGLAGPQVKLNYFNGSAWLSALEYANVSGGGAARSTLVLMKNGGNVGVGTTSPLARLDVNGGARFTPGGSGGAVNIGSPGGTETGINISNGTGRGELRFNGSTLKLVAGPDVGPPPATNGVAVTTAGNVGVGTDAPSIGKLHVVGGPGQPAVFGTSPNRGVWGVSTGSSFGLFGESVSGIGAQGVSTSNIGVGGISGSNHGVAGTSASGIGVRGETASTNIASPGVQGVSTGAGGVGVRGDGTTGVYGVSASGVGVTGESATGFAVYANGNAGQARDKGGFVKAMLHVNPFLPADQYIVRCYNGLTNSSTGNCGFTVTRGDVGDYSINFGAGFIVNDRFFSLTFGFIPLESGEGLLSVRSGHVRPFGTTNLAVFVSKEDKEPVDNQFYLIVY